MATITVQNTDSILDTLATHIFENHGPEIGNAATNKNFILANLDRKGKKVVVGGLDFAEPVLKSENTNFSWRSHYTTIDANIQDPFREFKFEPKTLSGTIVINQKHKAQNSGRAAIKNLMNSLRLQADTTISNSVNSALWASSPGANDPESIQSIVSATPTTGTIGGQNRSGNTWAQNLAYTTAIADIGSEAGLSQLHRQRTKLGGDANTNPDMAVTTATLFGGLYGYMDNLRRVRADEQMTKLGFDTFYVGTALLSYDGDGGSGECPEGYFYYLNTKHLFWKILQGGNFVFEPFSRKNNSLNSTSIFYLFANLTTNLPSSMGVLTDVSTS